MLITVYTHEEPMQAHVMRGRLEADGIDARPEFDLASVDHAVQASFTLPTGQLQVHPAWVTRSSTGCSSPGRAALQVLKRW
jgi:hypothetical protein